MPDRHYTPGAQAGLPSSMPYDLAYRHEGVGIYWDRVAPTEFPEHAHPEVEVAMSFGMPSGPALWHTASGREVTHRMREGYVSILPSGQPHSGVWEREAEVLVFYLDPQVILRAARESVRDGSVELVGTFTTEDTLIRQLGLSLRRELRTGAPPGRLYVESAANVLAVHLLRRYSATSEPLRELSGGLSEAALRRTTDYIHENLTRDVTLSGMADVAGFSPHYFSRLFKRATGYSPYGFVISQRVEKAKELLANTDLPVAEIAHATGFANQSHLGRHVKRLLGVSPTSLRRRSR